MAIDRRRFLLGSALVPLLARSARAASPLFAATCAEDSGGYALRAFDAAGRMAWRVALPTRGHGMACGRGRLVAFARRPGDWALVLDAATGAERARIAAPDGLAFNGHGAFSADGRRLFATATRREDDSGWLIVLDAEGGWRPTGLWPSGGSDPHEVLRVGERLAVANGGLPEGEPARHADEVETSLAWLDARSGALLAVERPPESLRSVSLRHMAARDGRVFVVGQDQGPAHSGLPLLAVSRGDGLDYRATPSLDGYCGSVAAGAQALCVASPRAGLAYLLDETGAPSARFEMADVCAVAAAPGGGFLIASGRGRLRGPGGAEVETPGLRWDNHAVPL